MPDAPRPAEVFCAALPEPVRAAWAAIDQLDAILERAHAGAQMPTPAAAPSLLRHLSSVATRVAEVLPSAAAIERLDHAGIALADACADGEPRAVAAFTRVHLADIDHAIGRARAPAHLVDDIRQIVLAKLLPPGRKLARYGGTGALQNWIRAVTVRESISVLRSAEAPALDEDAVAEVAAGGDLELSFVKGTYREQFREVSSARAAMLLTGTELEIGGAEALRDRADATADPRLAAEARALLGTVIARAARWDEAMPVLEDAYLRAYELGDDALATDTACNLALGATWRGDHEDALRWSNLALAIAPTPERRAAIGSTASQALLAMGRTADAEAALAEALSDGAPPDVRASALTTLGTMRTQAGQLDLAEPALVEAIALVEQHAGPGHPDAIAAINVLGIVQIQRGRLRDAVLTLERAHAAAVADYGELHPFVGFVLGNLGMVYRQLGDYDRGYRTLLAARRR